MTKKYYYQTDNGWQETEKESVIVADTHAQTCSGWDMLKYELHWNQDNCFQKFKQKYLSRKKIEDFYHNNDCKVEGEKLIITDKETILLELKWVNTIGWEHYVKISMLARQEQHEKK